MSAVAEALRLLETARKDGKTYDEAARELAQRRPKLVADAQEDLGLWPASEPADRALQNVRVR